MPEGRIVFAGEPLLEVTAPIAEAQLAETVLCNTMTFHTTAASKAARSRIAAAGTMELVDFGLRRTQGIEAGMVVARATAMVGFAATSNVEAAWQLGLTPAGTMAHSYVEAFPTETQAFRAFAEDLPEQATFLVDTYDTLGGVREAVDVIRSLGLEHRAGIRLDSGDLSVLSKESRRILDEAGLPEVRIVVSGGLDEHRIADLVAAGAPVDVAGIGTRLGVSADAPYLDTVYKLVAYDGRPVAKLSASKETLGSSMSSGCARRRPRPTPSPCSRWSWRAGTPSARRHRSRSCAPASRATLPSYRGRPAPSTVPWLPRCRSHPP